MADPSSEAKGLDAEIQEKVSLISFSELNIIQLKDKYDPELESKACQWLTAITGEGIL